MPPTNINMQKQRTKLQKRSKAKRLEILHSVTSSTVPPPKLKHSKSTNVKYNHFVLGTK